MDPVLHRECLGICASLSISWTIPCCMVGVSSCRWLSLAYFIPKALDSFFFLELTHFFDLLPLSTLYFGICSLIMLTFLHSSPVMGSILHSLVDLPDSIFNPIFSFKPFLKGSPLSPYHFSLWSLGWKWIRDILLYMEYRSHESVVFHTSFIFWIIDKNSLVIFVAILQWTPLWP